MFKIGKAHAVVLRWTEANGYSIVGLDQEINLYNTEPITLDNPTYVTEIQYPVEKKVRDQAYLWSDKEQER